MGNKEQAQCLICMGIILFVVGIFYWWFLMVMGGAMFIIGICISSQSSKSTASQPIHQSASQMQQNPQDNPQLIPDNNYDLATEQISINHRFCPHCGARATGKYCTDCGAEID